MALELLSDVPKSVNTLFTDYLCVVCGGQMQDLYLQARLAQPSKREIYQLMKTKTAAYTITLPLVVGATLAEQPPATIKQLRRFGDVVGTIFQIRDDELGVMGEAEKTGKPVGADIREGKKTLVYYYLLQKCSAPERRNLQSVFGNSNLSDKDITAIQKLIRKHRITQLLDNEVQHLQEQALKVLEAMELAQRYKTELRSLLAFCAKRQA
jgi:geranylgeranyl diphosphate synthase type I